ncbi:MAG: hypothetical protein SynsKO_11920 [Synoicihabitans sp.]
MHESQQYAAQQDETDALGKHALPQQNAKGRAVSPKPPQLDGTPDLAAGMSHSSMQPDRMKPARSASTPYPNQTQ